MLVIVGWIVVMVCVIGGYIAMGGKLDRSGNRLNLLLLEVQA